MSSRSAVREARRLPNPGLIDASYVAPPSQRARTRALPPGAEKAIECLSLVAVCIFGCTYSWSSPSNIW